MEFVIEFVMINSRFVNSVIVCPSCKIELVRHILIVMLPTVPTGCSVCEIMFRSQNNVVRNRTSQTDFVNNSVKLSATESRVVTQVGVGYTTPIVLAI